MAHLSLLCSQGQRDTWHHIEVSGCGMEGREGLQLFQGGGSLRVVAATREGRPPRGASTGEFSRTEEKPPRGLGGRWW